MQKSMKGIEKEVRTRKIKRYVTLICIVACIMVVVLVMLNSRRNIKIAERQAEDTQAITITARAKNNNNYTEVTSEDNIAVPVPKGYVASPNVEERYVNGVTTNGVREHHGGFVIYEKNAGETDEQATEVIAANLNTAKTSRNQYVWVPISNSEVSNMSNTSYEPTLVLNYDKDNTYLKSYMEGISGNEFLQRMRKDFIEMLESVKSYEGFYIGRYETGNISSKVPVVRKQNNNISNVNWYQMYKACKNLKAGNNSVQTGIIWETQFKKTLNWLINSGEKTNSQINDATSWGNYYNSSGGGSLRPTGSNESWKANNIYDLAGNAFDWTMGGNSAFRRELGGCYSQYVVGNANPVNFTNGYYPTESRKTLCCRAMLYIL